MSADFKGSLGETRVNPCPESPRPPEDRPVEQPALDFVCDVCNGVDWLRVANLKDIYRGQRYPWRVVIPSLNATSAELSTSPCKVCRILAAIKPSTYDGHRCVLYAYRDWHGYTQLRVISQQIHGLETRSLHIYSDQEVFPCLTVIGSSDDQDLKSMKVQLNCIDSRCCEDLKGIMRNCVQSHGQTCRPMSKSSRIPGFKVIEVSSRKVIEVSDQCEYLALSYVWGNHEHSDDLRAAPPVIQDTFFVAENLGLKYVWIDKYCITSEGPEKQEMFSRMGEIYSNAYCTVIAAAGEDAQTGLPGVSRARQQQREVNVKGVTLIELPYSKDHGSALLSSSKWATRGWTYQEGYLSTRRLIFTEYRLLYLCNREFAPEPFKKQESTSGVAMWSKEHWARKHSFARFVPHTAFSGHRASAANVREQIQEYTRRDLSHSEDSLNAFLGVLDYNSRTPRPMAHLWGLPLYEDQASAPQPRDVLFELFWWHEAPSTRRHRFPSWTWVGWAGPVRFRTRNKVRMFPEGLRLPLPSHLGGTNVSVTGNGGQTLLYEYADALLKKTKTGYLLQSQLGPIRLLVSCHVLPLWMQRFHLSEDRINDEYIMATQHPSSAIINTWSRRPNHRNGGHLAVVQVCSGIYMCIRPWLDQEVRQWSDCFALHFGSTQNTSPGLFTRDRNLLLVRRVRGEVYKRVGLIHWHFLDFDQSIFFIDEEGDFMDEVVLPAEDELFCSVAEEKTICLA